MRGRGKFVARLAIVTGLLIVSSTARAGGSSEPGRCDHHAPGEKNLFWGDLHVHTSFSLDAYAFGNRLDPGDAYAFARGQQLTLADGKTMIDIGRPLDFMAVTDHAETFNVMYLCADPEYQDNEYCEGLRDGSTEGNSLNVFYNYLIPMISGDRPKPSPLCEDDASQCRAAALNQWRRTQEYANAANAPCEFTAFVGNEWSATPNDRHWHRNIIYASDVVSREAIDYINYPTVDALWRALNEQCKAEDGCDVITIPHNTNMAEGGGFDVETAGPEQLERRAKYERLLEIHQSKGNSECLPENWDDAGSDCGFEIYIPRKFDESYRNGTIAEDDWRGLRASYARSVLARGLVAYASSDEGVNPLQMGLIGSTDNHSATPGDVTERGWNGDAWSWNDDVEQRFKRLNYNPGGLVAVWAEENTRQSIFAALKRREVYATSGPRIGLRVKAGRGGGAESCDAVEAQGLDTAMGGQLATGRSGAPSFVVQAVKDETPLAAIEIIKGSVKDGDAVEQRIPVFSEAGGRSDLCVTWTDESFDPNAPAFWYVRVLEQATPRWSRIDCQAAGNCEDYPQADQMIQERAWSSPIWYLP